MELDDTPKASGENRQRLIESAAAILSAAANHELNTTNLNKALFYLDLLALRDFGSQVTGVTYIALEQGPVVAKYEKRLIKPLAESGVAVQRAKGTALPIKLAVLAETLKYKLLNEREVALAHVAGKWASNLTAKSVSDISHNNPGWHIAYYEGLGGPTKIPKPIDLRIAMQQIVDSDTWVKEALTESEKASVGRAETAEGEIW